MENILELDNKILNRIAIEEFENNTLILETLFEKDEPIEVKTEFYKNVNLISKK